MSPPRFGVYIHWPYCARICPYCDFNVYRARGRDEAGLIAAIAADLRGQRARIGHRVAETVFLGGGTPSLLAGAQIAELLAAVDAAFPIAAGAEITLEANPEDRIRFAQARAAGVNRFSIGAQALRDDALKALGRDHDAAAAIAAVADAAGTGARVSLDLIYARPEQTLADWSEELGQALALPVGHLSLYQLTIEPNTAFGYAARRGALRVPDADAAAEFYEHTEAQCAQARVSGYEISNYARRPDDQARHNLLYWTHGEWVGAGPGAHGRVAIDGARIETIAHERPNAYIGAVAATGVGFRVARTLSPEEDADERLAMGLRLAAGVERAPIEHVRGRAFPEATLRELVEAGVLADDAHRLRLTAAGRLVADRVAAMLAAG